VKVGTIIKIGNSLGVIIPRATLRKLGWWQGDKVVQSADNGEFKLQNLAQLTVKPRRDRSQLGDSVR
jgi:antitoxin component of MazEF toxin-antitoxin module